MAIRSRAEAQEKQVSLIMVLYLVGLGLYDEKDITLRYALRRLTPMLAGGCALMLETSRRWFQSYTA